MAPHTVRQHAVDGSVRGRRTRRRLLAIGLPAMVAMGVFAAPAGAQDGSMAAPAEAAEGWVRVGHFAAGGGAVDVLVDGVVRSEGVRSGSVTPYVRVPAGTHRVQAVPRTAGAVPLVDVEAGVVAGGSVTVGVVTTLDGVGAEVYDDSLDTPPPGQALVRFIHTVPDIPAVDIAVAGGPVLASNVAFPAASAYVPVAAGSYDVEVRRNGTDEVLIAVQGWSVAAGARATVIVNRTDAGALSVVPVLDAGGAGAMPVGGAATGMGGLASSTDSAASTASIVRTVPSSALWSWWVAAVGVVLVAAWLVVRDRARCATRPLTARRLVPVVAVSASVGLAACGTTTTTTATTATTATSDVATSTTTASTTAPTSAPDVSGPAESGDAPGPAVVSGANVNVVAVGEPRAIRIPSLGIASSLVPLGIAADGTAEVPSTADQAGWFAGGPRPGETGAAVVLGHVDSQDGPGVFARLRDIRPGAPVVIESGDGDAATEVTFVVSRIEQVAKDRFPSKAVYGAVPEAALRLVTCGGSFDRTSGHYRDNVIVYLTAAGEPG